MRLVLLFRAMMVEVRCSRTGCDMVDKNVLIAIVQNQGW